MEENIYSVSEVNNYIKNILDNDGALRNVQVVGEVSNFKRYPSGHCYFTLKDNGGVLKAVMFRARAMSLRFEPKNGDTVLAVGRISVYERDGVYQLYTDLLLQQGQGDLMLAYEKLKEKLEAEGLFSQDRKQPLPVNPKVVGIITSPAGAAVRDIITVSRRRNSGIKLLLYPVKVQGDGAADEIARAVEFFNKNKLADVLIVGRGGGSIEELWAFNEERTVRAVAASKIPVISAVGHETDFTLCDFAADKRAATPSQAAELAVIDAAAVKQRVLNLYERLYSLVNGEIEYHASCVQHAVSSWVFTEPERIFETQALRTDAAASSLAQNMTKRLEKSRHRFELNGARLNSLSPLAVLGRGYSVTATSEGHVLKSADDVSWGQEIVTTVADGRVISIVQETERRQS